ncbi:MAG: hypothetical protein R2715_00510 [Ilumatobacteraceae bacterium]
MFGIDFPAIPTCDTSIFRPSSKAIRCARTSRVAQPDGQPWPGIVDVEPMPGADDDEGGE